MCVTYMHQHPVYLYMRICMYFRWEWKYVWYVKCSRINSFINSRYISKGVATEVGNATGHGDGCWDNLYIYRCYINPYMFSFIHIQSSVYAYTLLFYSLGLCGLGRLDASVDFVLCAVRPLRTQYTCCYWCMKFIVWMLKCSDSKVLLTESLEPPF